MILRRHPRHFLQKSVVEIIPRTLGCDIIQDQILHKFLEHSNLSLFPCTEVEKLATCCSLYSEAVLDNLEIYIMYQNSSKPSKSSLRIFVRCSGSLLDLIYVVDLSDLGGIEMTILATLFWITCSSFISATPIPPKSGRQ